MIRLISIFFVAFGIVLGGSLLAGLGAVLTRQAPLELMKNVALDIKFWAILGAIGGTFEALKGLDEGVLRGHISVAVRQILYIMSAFAGANIASYILVYIVEGKEIV